MPDLVPQNPTESNIEKAGELIRAGELVGMPTDTVYGLAADATNDAAVERVFTAKRRPMDKPLIVLVGTLEEAARHGLFTDTARRLAATFWPGPLTLILPRREGSPLSGLVNPLGDTVSLRVPGNDVALALIKSSSRPLTAPSANLSGAPSPTRAQAVVDGLSEELAMVLDGGASPSGSGSTILALTDDGARILREGGISRTEIERVIDAPVG